MTKTAVSPQYAGVSEPGRPPDAGLDAFNAVYEREFDYVWRTAARFGVPPGDLADAAHEVFLVLYRKWHDLERKDELRPWLFGVARRVAAGFRAKRREELVTVDAAVPVDPLAAKRELLYRAMDSLDEDRRAVIILHDLEGRTGAEIAALLDIPANTVHSRLRLARADLLEAVRKLGGTR